MTLRKSAIIGAVIVVALALMTLFNLTQSSGKARQTPSEDTLQTQTKTAGPVTITVTPLSLSAGQEMRFAVSLDTHSGDLSDDLSTISTLRDNVGGKATPPVWTGDPPGGHHRKGELVFPARSSLPNALTLTMQSDTMGEQEFRWNL